MSQKPDKFNGHWWRSLEHFSGKVAGSEREFQEGETDGALEGFDRRSFLKLMGASIALAAGGVGMTGCAKPQPLEQIVPYVRQPEGLVPGVPRFYASAIPIRGYARGVIVEQNEGRPTKIEGNPDHPSSLGSTDIFTQASILQLYDPDRAKNVSRLEETSTWGNFTQELSRLIEAKGGAEKVRLRILIGPLTSPTVIGQLQQLQGIFPLLQIHSHDPIGDENVRAGQQAALGRLVMPVYDFTKARRIVSLDSHFMGDLPGSVRYAREFIYNRRLRFKKFGPHELLTSKDAPAPTLSEGEMARLYMAESTVTFTGARADHRLPMKASLIPALGLELARRLGAAPSAAGTRPATGLDATAMGWVGAAADDLRSAGKGGLVLVGAHQPAELHALAYAINAQLGSVGTAVTYHEPTEYLPAGGEKGSLGSLTDALHREEVDLLLILDVNAAFNAPADMHFAETLQRFSDSNPAEGPARLAVYHGTYNDETARLCRWMVPLSHPLEGWGDCRGHDGTTSIVQPLIEPLWASKSVVELLAGLCAVGLQASPDERQRASAGRLLSASGYDLVREQWSKTWGEGVGAGEKQLRWRKCLHDGVIPETAAAQVDARPQQDLAAAMGALERAASRVPELEINIRPDPTLGDGQWANNPWLQELPKPLTHTTWENAAIVSPATAARLKLAEEPEWQHETRDYHSIIKITSGGTSIELPTWVQAGQPDDTITLYLGGGRKSGGKVQENVGTDIYPLRTAASAWIVKDAQLTKTSRTKQVACTQNHQVMDERDIVREREVSHLPPADAKAMSPDLYQTEKDKDGSKVHLSLYDEYRYAGYKWGMVIDLSACIGCQACVISCQAENNIPVVGREQVLIGREMHWLRIDTYYGGKETKDIAAEGSNPKILFQPMLCQHCENAPCEVVCPVEATSHSSEGINEMTYNRCVGTRYCSNNCPYKVRRFNFFQWNDHDVLTLNMQKNPNVTVRSRGVMEKCTFCVQRVNAARIEGKRDWSRHDRAGKQTEMRTVEPDGWLPGGAPEKLPRLRIITACQQACPTEAIIFGDLNDSESLVSRLKTKGPWRGVDYGVLTELSTQPRVSYLERISNPNPALPHKAEKGGEA